MVFVRLQASNPFFVSFYNCHQSITRRSTTRSREWLHTFHNFPSRKPLAGDRVTLAMSGGVDSSVSAFLLKSQGFLVNGVYMRNWDTSDERGVCTSEEDWHDVQEVCQKLGLDCKRIDFIKEYWSRVFTKMIDDYANGITPNPDVMCNSEIKFGALINKVLEEAEEANANGKEWWFATGHYARTERDISGRTKLLRGIDKNKDQSYYLSSISERALSRTIFPIGHLTKPRVKEIARGLGLSVAEKKESMGICFVGKKRRFGEFLAEYIDQKPGSIITDTGKIIGQHKGLFAYTIGQGAHIPSCPEKMFVLSKESATNTLIVVPGSNHPKLFARSFTAHSWHWISDIPPQVDEEKGLHVFARTRYQMEEVRAFIKRIGDNRWIIELDQPVRAITPGQNVVIWDGDFCIGGGVIESVGESEWHCRAENNMKIAT